MPLTEEEAKARLERMTDASTDPQLAEEDLDDLLAMARRMDAGGLPPSDDDWVPTYDLNFAAAEGWRRKAGRAAALFNHGVDGASFQRSQIYSQCLVQAKEYSSRAPTTITVTR